MGDRQDQRPTGGTDVTQARSRPTTARSFVTSYTGTRLHSLGMYHLPQRRRRMGPQSTSYLAFYRKSVLTPGPGCQQPLPLWAMLLLPTM